MAHSRCSVVSGNVLSRVDKKDEVIVLLSFKKSRNTFSPTFFLVCPPALPTVTPQIIWSVMPRRGQIVVISQVELLFTVGILSMLFLVADSLIGHVLQLGASMKLQGHHWTVWIIRKFSLISSWNLPPYNPTHWIWLCLLDLQENEFTSLSTCDPLKLPTCRQLPCLSKPSYVAPGVKIHALCCC